MRTNIFYRLFFCLMAIGAVVLGITSVNSLYSTSVEIEWSTASELDTVGFNILRAETKDGVYTRVNADLIAASSDPLMGGNYTYADQGVKPGRTYYYLLEDVDGSGQTSRNGPLEVKATASGWGELAAALVLLIIALFSLRYSFRQSWKMTHAEA
jgi:hypothetical protein